MVCSRDTVYNDLKKAFYIAKTYNVRIKYVIFIKTNEKGMFSSYKVYIINMRNESEK